MRDSWRGRHPRKIPGWTVVVGEIFSVNKGAYRKKNNGNCIQWFLYVFFFKLYICCHAFHPIKLKIIRMIFEVARGRKLGGEQ